jgi:hypothetical protein
MRTSPSCLVAPVRAALPNFDSGGAARQPSGRAVCATGEPSALQRALADATGSA